MARGIKKQRGDGTRLNGRSHRADAGISATYRDMLDKVNSSPTQTSDEGRAIKKRRIRETPGLIHPLQQEQTAYKDDSSEQSDFAWEEVGLPSEDGQFFSGQREQEEEEEEELNLVLDGDGDGDGEREPIPAAAARRKPLTAIERRHRL
ncbi:MAG: hypothetical protein LQ337_007807 [Flavoplaca oasis]|nr:MAG: hypothetical protein LQ337_007807 [Flavoplaca oasis]